MAISPKSKGLTNIGNVVNRQGLGFIPKLATPDVPNTVAKPVTKAVKPKMAVPKPVVKPVTKPVPKTVVPKQASLSKPNPFISASKPRAKVNPMATQPAQNPFAMTPEQERGMINLPGIGGPLPLLPSTQPGNPIPMPGQQPSNRPTQFAGMPDDLYNSMIAYDKRRDDAMQAAKAAGDPMWFALPETADIKPWTQWMMDNPGSFGGGQQGRVDEVFTPADAQAAQQAQQFMNTYGNTPVNQIPQFSGQQGPGQPFDINQMLNPTGPKFSMPNAMDYPAMQGPGMGIFSPDGTINQLGGQPMDTAFLEGRDYTVDPITGEQITRGGARLPSAFNPTDNNDYNSGFMAGNSGSLFGGGGFAGK